MTPRRRQRGYALVIVVLLTLVVGLMLSVAMQREGAQSLTVARQARAYREHHAVKGIQEAIRAWVRTIDARSIDESLGEDGHALDVTLGDGTVMSVYVHDGQGTALGDLTAVPSGQVDAAGRTLRYLAELVSEDEFKRLTRPGGPAAVSVNTAPEQVLRAVLLASMPEQAAEDVLRELLNQRASGEKIDRSMINEAARTGGAGNDGTNTALSLLSVEPELWYVRVIARKPLQGETARYGGLVRLRSGRTISSDDGTGTFITWEDLGDGPDATDPPPGVPELP